MRCIGGCALPVEGTTKLVEKLPKWNERQSEMAYYVLEEQYQYQALIWKALGVHGTNYTFEFLPVPPTSQESGTLFLGCYLPNFFFTFLKPKSGKPR